MSLPDNHRQLESPSFRLATLDPDFLLSDPLRGLRFMLEHDKAEQIFDAQQIRSTLVVFGSARVRPLDQPADVAHLDDEVRARHDRWYQQARAFAALASREGGALNPQADGRYNVIITGGGPGIMEAANRGAAEVGAPSIGLNITLPQEQQPNQWITPELCMRFHYFTMRKMHFAMRAAGLVVFPGGFGTLDELFEVMTLSQTGKMGAIPIVLFDRDFWARALNAQVLLDNGLISPPDLAAFRFADTAAEAWQQLLDGGLVVPGRA